jgi:glutaminyl-tRNA synthetase
MRKGYFCIDKDTTENNLVFNRTVTLKDAWSKEQKKD